MPDRIIVVDGVRHRFPDGTTDDEIAKALGGYMAPSQQEGPSPAARAEEARQIGMRSTKAPRAGELTPTSSDWGKVTGTALPVLAAFAPEVGVPADLALQGVAGYTGARLKGEPVGQSLLAGAENALLPEAAKRFLKGGAKLLTDRVAPIFMQSALKPSVTSSWKAIAKGEVPPTVATALRENVNVGRGGQAKTQGIIDTTNQNVADIVQNLPGTPIRPAAVASHTAPMRDTFARQATPGADLAAFDRAVEDFMTQSGTTQAAQVGTKQVPTGILNAKGQPIMTTVPVMGRVPRDLSGAETQALKEGTYKQLKNQAYGSLKPADIEAQKALAHGMKVELEKAAEAHSPMQGFQLEAENAREGAAIKLREAMARRLATRGNTDIAGLGWLAHNPAATLGFMASRSPWVKSAIANTANQTGKRIPAMANSAAVRAAIIAMLEQQKQ